jgi:hypothetical protein
MAGYHIYGIDEGMGASAGFPDLLVLRHGLAILLEVKLPKKKATPVQEAVHHFAYRHGMRVHVVRCLEEALAAVEEELAPD